MENLFYNDVVLVILVAAPASGPPWNKKRGIGSSIPLMTLLSQPKDIHIPLEENLRNSVLLYISEKC